MSELDDFQNVPTAAAAGSTQRPTVPPAGLSSMSEKLELVEIDQRSDGRLEISLLWSPDSRQLAVLVIDEAAEEAFALEVAANEALDAFRHPFVYLEQRQPIYRRALAGLVEAA